MNRFAAKVYRVCAFLLKQPRVFDHSFGVSWRKALVSLPRIVPNFVLRYTSPDGPQPIVFKIPARGQHQIPLYVFIPALDPNAPSQEKLPVLIDFHGGGFILGSCQEQAPFCSKISRELHCIVISVDYRLGPYARYPAANEDAEDVVNAVLDPSKPGYTELRDNINKHMARQSRPATELDADRIAFSGFSSGGNLALNLAISVKDDPTICGPWPSVLPEHFPFDVPILLFYPSLDCRLLPTERPRPDGLAPPKGFLSRWRVEHELMPTYLPIEKRGHPRASPGLAEITNGGLHPKAKMMLVLPEFDSLASQSTTWIEKVTSAGRGDDLVVESVDGVYHGWTQFPDAWLSDEHRKLKVEIFDKARDFVQRCWTHD